jgi:hypothetical protein
LDAILRSAEHAATLSGVSRLARGCTIALVVSGSILACAARGHAGARACTWHAVVPSIGTNLVGVTALTDS